MKFQRVMGLKCKGEVVVFSLHIRVRNVALRARRTFLDFLESLIISQTSSQIIPQQ
jgi:hypothetical protein